MTTPTPTRRSPNVFRYFLIGFFTVAPLWVTWVVFDFLFGLLARTGAPVLRGLARLLRPFSETVSSWLIHPGVQYGLAALLTLVGLYAIGLLTSFVVGKKLIAFLEGLLTRVPLVQTIYGATRRFLQSVSKPPMKGQRVVLIRFPTQEMKAVGLITKVMRDADTGEELVAVYVPTSPNPTSGYIEILPLADVVMTDWSVEEAMTFVMTGGTNARDSLRFSKPAAGGEGEIPGRKNGAG
jgi:uncharacterized membrane protein